MRQSARRAAHPRAAPARRSSGAGGCRTAARTACAFAAGGLVPFTAWFVLLPGLGALDLYRGGTLLRPLAVLVLACASGGVVAGGALGGRLSQRVGFGAAFGAALWIPFAVLSGVPALSGGEPLTGLVVGFTPGFALSYAAVGALGPALGGSGWRRALAGAAVFGGAGACGGVLLALVVRSVAGCVGAAAVAATALGGGAACLLPLALGGWWLGRQSHSHPRGAGM